MSRQIIPFHKPPITKKDLENVLDSLITDDLFTGKVCHNLENIISQLSGKKYVLSVNSLTAAYHLIWLVLSLDNNSEVITPSYYNGKIISSLGLVKSKPVVLDFHKDGFHYDNDELKSTVNENTRAVLIPYMYGDLRNQESINAIRDMSRGNVTVVEDLTHCLGNFEEEPQKQIKGGDISIVSLADDSIITTGNGALILTDVQKLYLRLKELRGNSINGNLFQKDNPVDGRPFDIRYDYKMADFQAALALSQVKNLKKFNERRKEIATLYRKVLLRTDHKYLHEEDQAVSFRFPVILSTSLETALSRLRKEKIKVRHKVYYPIHRLLGLSGEKYYQTNRLYQKLLELPIYPQMRKKEIDRIIQVISKLS